MNRWLHVVWILPVLYLLYAVVFGVFSYLLPKPVLEEHRAGLSAERLYGDPAVPGPDRAALIEETTAGFDERVRLAACAAQTLDVVVHCAKTGQSTEQFFAELLAAADRGVQVRLVMDGKVSGMTGEFRNISLALAAHPNVQYRLYNQLNLLRPWEWNALLHDKFMLVDGRYLLLGGRNLGDEYFTPPGYTGRVTNDRDVLVFNTAAGEPAGKTSAVNQTADYMEELWNHPATTEAHPRLTQREYDAAQEETARLRILHEELLAARPELYTATPQQFAARTVPTARVTLLHNPLNTSKKEPWVGFQLRELLLGCERSVTIQTPYATANGHTLAALRDIAARGEVRYLTNSIASSPNYPAFSTYITQRLKFVLTGVDIYEYQSTSSIHGKSCLMDGRFSAVGSCNLDDRSLYIDTETMLVIDSPQFCEQLNAAVGQYLLQSQRVGPDNRYLVCDTVPEQPVPFVKRLLMWLVSFGTRLIEYLI